MRGSYLGSVILVYLFTSMAYADETKSQCGHINNANDLLNCILSTHPEIKIQEARFAENKKEIGVAAQMPNPDFGLEGVGNKTGGVSGELAILHTFELGGKRDSRIKVARAQNALSKAELLKVQEKIAIHTVLKIYRLRQVETELKAIQENLETFKGIQAKYRRSSKLNPEQQVSVSVFKFAEEDNKLKANSLIGERERILSDFRLTLGENFKISEKVLPKIKKVWPSISVNHLRGADMLKVEGELDVAMAKSELANSESWPNLSIGPKVEIDTGQNSETRVGLALTMPLPFYNTNSGGRSKARMGVQKSSLEKQWSRNSLNRQVQLLIGDYERSSKVVSKSISESQIGAKHEELHKLIRRGVVSAPLIIEMHREILEFYKSLHSQELVALESLWTLYALRGSILKENLE